MLTVPSGPRTPADSVRLHWLQANAKLRRSQTDHNTVTEPDDEGGALVQTQPAGAPVTGPALASNHSHTPVLELHTLPHWATRVQLLLQAQ